MTLPKPPHFFPFLLTSRGSSLQEILKADIKHSTIYIKSGKSSLHGQLALTKHFWQLRLLCRHQGECWPQVPRSFHLVTLSIKEIIRKRFPFCCPTFLSKGVAGIEKLVLFWCSAVISLHTSILTFISPGVFYFLIFFFLWGGADLCGSLYL